MGDRIKNLPDRIWLQVVGDSEPEPDDDYKVLAFSGEVTFSDSQIYDHDVEYVHAVNITKLEREAAQLKAEVKRLQKIEKAAIWWAASPCETTEEDLIDTLDDDEVNELTRKIEAANGTENAVAGAIAKAQADPEVQP